MTSYQPTEVHRKLVQALAERFLPNDDIALLLEQTDGTMIDEQTLVTVFAHELRMGRTSGRYAVAKGLTDLAKNNNVSALIYLSKVHLGWSEQPSKTKPAADESAAESERAGAPMPRLPTAKKMGQIFRIQDRSSRRS